MSTSYKMREKFENISFDLNALLCLQEIEDFLNEFYNEEMGFTWYFDLHDQSISADTFNELFQNNLFQMANSNFDSLTLGISPKNRCGHPIIFTITKDYRNSYYASFYGETENAKFKHEIKDFITNLITNNFIAKEIKTHEQSAHRANMLNQLKMETKNIDWTMIGVIIGIIGLILTIFINLGTIERNAKRIVNNLNKSNTKLMIYKETTKNTKSNQNINSANAIEDLRKNRKLNLINDLENELTIDKIENNTYCFTYGFIVDSAIRLKEKFKVFIDDNNTRFEVHKYNNNIYIVGYTNEENLIRLNSKEKQIKFYLFNRQDEKANKIVSVPFHSIASFKEREYRNSIVADVELK